MKRTGLMTFTAVVAAIIVSSPNAQAGAIDNLFKRLRNALGGTTLSEQDIVSGLKEALRVGTKNAVALVSRVNGYYKTEAIRIRLPESVRNAEKVLRVAGFGSTIDRFEVSMNRAAETAAPQATELFIDAIGQMTFADARQILDGPDDAATRYFERQTAAKLKARFKPLVANSMAEVGVTRHYRQLEKTLRSLSIAHSAVFDLDQYVTEKAVQGLFVMLAREESAIRKDPAARVTELLRKVFGNRDKQ